MSRIYVAGGMSGYDNLNFPAFDSSSRFLRMLGWDVINPADMDRAMGIDPGKYDSLTAVPESLRQDALARDFLELCTCDAIALLPGWEKSRGATAERFVAEQIGLDVYLIQPQRIEGAWSLVREVPAVLVALCGVAQSGKDTVGQIMAELAGFERIAFADPLKAVATACHPKIAEFVRLAGWEETKRQYPASREFLQDLGVAVRDHVDPDAWVNAAMRNVRPGGKYAFTDCRFPNEAAAIKAAGGYVVQVTRPGVGPVNGHVSETALAGYEYDAVLRNSGSLDDLKALVRIFLGSL